MKTNEPISNPGQASDPLTDRVPSSQKSLASKPITVWLLAVLVVLLLGTTGLFAYKYYDLKQQFNQQPTSLIPPAKVTTTSPTPMPSPQSIADPAAGWETYTNEKYGFSFKYPEKWFMIDNLDKTKVRIDEKQLTPFEDEMGMGPFYSGYIGIEVLEQRAPKEVQIADPVGTKKCEGAAYCVLKVGDLLVDEKQAAKIELTAGVTGEKSYWYEIQLGNQRIKIVNGTQEEHKLQIIEQILSTFEFTS